jgi:hypothetical protein
MPVEKAPADDASTVCALAYRLANLLRLSWSSSGYSSFQSSVHGPGHLDTDRPSTGTRRHFKSPAVDTGYFAAPGQRRRCALLGKETHQLRLCGGPDTTAVAAGEPMEYQFLNVQFDISHFIPSL